MLEEFGSEISALNIAEDSARKREKGWLYSVLLKRSLGISDLIEGYRRKDTSAIKAVETMTYYAAITVSNLVLLMDPELIIIGGDFVKVHSGFVKDVHTRIKKILEGRPDISRSCNKSTFRDNNAKKASKHVRKKEE